MYTATSSSTSQKQYDIHINNTYINTHQTMYTKEPQKSDIHIHINNAYKQREDESHIILRYTIFNN